MLTKESTLSPAQTSEVDVDVSQSGTLEHLLPDASFLLYGVFSQSGFDLEITNPDGINHVVPDYFSFPTPPNLMIESGAGLSPAMVKSLFPRAFGQDVLFAGPAPSGAALVEIGSVKLVVGTVTVRHADGSQEAVKKGAVLYQGDVLVTGPGSFVKAEMRDGTKFQLGQNGEAALDQYEFDEAADVGRFEATVRVGGFYYKSGKIGELPSASAQAHTQLNTPTSIIGVRGSELEGAVDQSGETVVVHRSGVLEITDINGDNAVTLDTPGNTAVVVLNGQPAFTAEPSQQAQQALQQSLPPPDGSVAEDEAVEADAEEVAEEVVEEAVAEAEEAVEESAEEEAVEEVVEEVAEEVEEAELDEAADAEEEAEETSDEEDLDSLGVDESSVESQSDAENAEDVASNEGEGEAVESSDDEALSTFTNPDTSVESATEDVDTTLETLQSQDSNVEGQDSGELQTLGAASTNIEESVAEVEDVVAEEPQEVIAPDNPPEALADEITVLAGGAIDVTEQLLGNDSDPDAGQVLAIISVDSARPDAVTLVDGRVQFQPDESLLQSLSAGETTTETLSYTVESGTSKADADVVIVYQGSNDAPVANNDVAETNEDVPLVLAVISNDSDPDLADTLVITSVDGSTALGVITITDDGQSLLYEPSQSLSEGSVDDVFSYTISDGNTTATATVTVTVAGVNDPPVLVSDPTGFTLELVPEAGEISIPLDAIFADSDLGSTLTVLALDTELTRGAVRIGSVLYDPGDAFDYLKEGEIGIEQFGITVQDEFGQTGQGVFSFQIEGINDAPVAVANTNEVPENGAIDLAAASSVLGDDADVDGDALTVSSIRTGNVAATDGAQGEIGSTLVGAYGVLTLNADGQYRYATTASAVDGLAAGATAVDVFTYTITDGALSASAELLITVTGVNDAPVAVANTNAVLENGAIDLAAASSVLGDDADVDGDALTVSSIRTGNVAATDGAQGEIGSTLVGAYGVLTLNADGQYRYATTASAVDGLAAGATAVDVFTYTITDGALSASAELLITVTGVNDAPVAVANTNEVPENGAIDLAAASSVLGDDADVDGDALTVSSIRTGNVAATDGAQGEIGSTLVGAYGVLTLNADGQYRYATTASAVDGLAAGATAVDVFTYTITDGALSASAELLITVTGVNDAPVAVANTNEVPENGAIDLAAASSVLGDDADVDGDALTVSSIRTGNVAATDGAQGEIGSTLVGAYGVLTLNADGQYRYATTASAVDGLAAGATAVDVFTYTITDGALSASAELLITVTGVNDAPVAVANTNEVPENGAIDLAAASSVLGDDADVDGDALTVSSIRTGNVAATDGAQGEIGSTLVGAYGVLTLNADGQYRYATTASAVDGLAAGATAVDVFTYTITDGALSASAELLITVTGVNDAPVAVANTNEVPENGAIDLAAASSVLGDDADVDGDALTVSSIRTGNVAATDGAQGEIGSTLVGAYGVLTLNADGQYRYATTASAVDGLAAGATAVDVFTYTITDGALSASAELLITVTGVNDAPVAVANTNEVPENGAIDLAAASSVLGDDADVDGDALTVSSIRTGNVAATDGAQGEIGSTLVGAYGVLTLNADGQYRYATTASAVDGLAAGATAVDVFTYTITDGALSASAELLITVTGVNDAAVIVVDAPDVSVTRNAEFDAVAGGQISISDLDLNQAEIVSATANFGVVTLGADGSWLYDLNDTNSEIVALNENLAETAVDTITFSSVDGSQVSLNITIYTANLPATLTLTLDDPNGLTLIAGDVVNETITGQITLTDNEGAVLLPIAADYGDVTQSGDDWTYSLQNDSISVQGLDDGESLTDIIVFTSDDARDLNADSELLDVDGSIEGRKTITVTISGRNDAPVVNLTPVATDQFQDEILVNGAQGVLSVAVDPDNADGSITDTLTVVGVRQGGLDSSSSSSGVNQGVVGLYGTLTVQTDGSYSYSADSALQDAALENAGSIEDVFTVQVSDGTETVEAELRFNIDNSAPVAVNGALSHQVVTTGSSGLLINYADFDELTITLTQTDALPEGFVITTPSSAIGLDLSISGSAGMVPESSVFFGSLTSVVGDYRLSAAVSDGDNTAISDQFILSIRSPSVLSTIDQVYEFVTGESDYSAVYLDPAENSGTFSVYAWSPSEAGDRMAVFGDTTVAVYSDSGTNLTLEGASLVDLNASPGADVITIKGSVSGLNFAGISALDTLVNQTLILASPGANAFQLQNDGIIQLTSSGVGDRISFEDASGNPVASPVVGVAQGDSLSFGDTVQTISGQILLTPDNQPAAPYLVLASLVTAGAVEVTGFNLVSISQPSELEIATTFGTSLSGSLIQSASGTISISSGGRVTTETLSNSGTITLTNNNYNGVIVGGAGSAGHLVVTGSYTESGTLISQVSDSFYIPASDPNELSAANMVLTGEIKANADLLFSNVNQSLDWRAGTITLAPTADLIIAGGSVILGAESTISGYGDLVFGQASAASESGSTIVIDGTVATAQFGSDFTFESSRVVIAPLTNAAADTLTISNLDQWTFDNEVVNTNLQIDGTLAVSGGISALNGSTTVAASGAVGLNETIGVNTNLTVSQTLTNLGNIEIMLEPLTSGELAYNTPITISGGSYTAATGLITIDTAAAHGLATGDVIRMNGAFPAGYNYTGEVTVVSSTSFSFAAASDPGAFQSGGSVYGFGSSLTLTGGLTNSGSLVVQGTKLESANQNLYSDERVLIDGDITNTVGGSLVFREGNIILEGNLSNAGVLEIDGDTWAGSESYFGAFVTLDGDLVLASTSILQLEVAKSDASYWVNGFYLETGALVRGADADALNLGALTLNFNDTSLGNQAGGQDSNTLLLFYENAVSGTTFSTLTTDLAAGYETELQTTVSSSDTSVQTISVVVSDDMEFESSANGNFGAESTVWARQPLLADVASASWSAGVATLVTSAAHGLTDNQIVTINGTTSSGYDYYGVISVIDDHTLTYNVSVDPVSDPGDLQVTDYYASNVGIASADWSSSDLKVTFVTDRDHGLVTGQVVDIIGNSPSSFDVYDQTVTVIDATTFTVSSPDPGTSWTSGGAILTKSPTINDDIRIVHALTVDAGESLSLNSFSLETSKTYGTSTTTTTVGMLSLDGDVDAIAETTTFNVADQSTVAYGSSLYVGSASSTSTDTVNLVLGEALTVHGWITLRTGATVNSGGNGKILISETGQGAIWDSVELNLDVEIEAGGGLSLAPFGPQVISGSGQIVSSGAIVAGVYNGIAIGVDIVNHGDLELRFDNTSSGAFEVVAGSETAIISDGRLIASSVRSGVLSLNDNTLDARGGELALFVNSGVSDTYGLTLVGGSAAASPGLIKLQDTVFSIPGRAVTISAVETSTAGIWTVSFTVSEPISYLVSPGISGGTLGSLSVATNNIDGSVTFTAEATKDPSGDMVITLADQLYGEYLGGELTIDSGGGTSFTSNLGTTGELNLTGHLELQLTGSVDFVVGDDALALTLQGSTADSIRLSNGAAETAALVNSETIYFNNLTVDTNVILVNAVDPDWASIDPAVITLSGVSVFDGDLYNLRDPESYTAATAGVYLLDSVTFNGAVLQQAGAYLYVGVDATLIGGRATSVVFTNDFINDGFMTVGSPAGALDHLIKVGSDAAAGTFSNSGNFTLQINASGSSSGTVELDGVLLNTGSVYALGQLTLDATSTAAQHESSGLIYLSGAYSGLTLGSDDILTMRAGSYLVANGVLQTSVIDASATGAALVLSGTLGIGDTVTDYVAGVASIAAGVGTLEVKTSSEFTVNAGSNLTLDAGFGLASSDSLLVSGPTGTLRLNGGRLSVTSTYSAATSVGLISATTILGSFDTIDGLILDTSGGRTVADVVQTATGISLSPVTNAAIVLAEGDGTGSVFDFGDSANANVTHYLALSGDDLIKSVDSGDSAFGEAGDDTFVLNSVAINRIDGGTGIDQIVLPGTINFDFTKEGIDNTLGTADDWLGHRFERIELLSMENATNQTMALDASALRSINDGANGLLNDEAGLVVKGNIGDVINLSGDFDYTEDRFAQMRTAVEPSSGSAVTMTYAPELFTGVSDGAVSLFFDQDVLVNVTHTNAGVSRYGHSGDDVLAGSSLGGETLAGRGGDDQLDGLAGADRQLGGDGNDSIVFDSADLEMDGGNGVDTLLLSGSVDFSQLDQLANFEQVDMSGNNSADSLSLTFADVFELVGDNSLDAYVPANDHKVLVINGDSEDALILNGVDIRNQTAVQTGIDLYGDGTTYALFQDTDLGVDVYVLSDLLSGASPSGSEKVSEPVMAAPTFDQYLYEPSADHFGGL